MTNVLASFDVLFFRSLPEYSIVVDTGCLHSTGKLATLPHPKVLLLNRSTSQLSSQQTRYPPIG